MRKRLTLKGFIVSDHFDRASAFRHEVGGLLKAGKIRYRETVVVGICEKGDSIAVGHPTPRFTFHPSLRVYRHGMIGFEVSPDGQKFLLVIAAAEKSRPLTLLKNRSALIAAK